EETIFPHLREPSEGGDAQSGKRHSQGGEKTGQLVAPGLKSPYDRTGRSRKLLEKILVGEVTVGIVVLRDGRLILAQENGVVQLNRADRGGESHLAVHQCPRHLTCLAVVLAASESDMQRHGLYRLSLDLGVSVCRDHRGSEPPVIGDEPLDARGRSRLCGEGSG